jgi:hypothetical protein
MHNGGVDSYSHSMGSAILFGLQYFAILDEPLWHFQSKASALGMREELECMGPTLKQKLGIN